MTQIRILVVSWVGVPTFLTLPWVRLGNTMLVNHTIESRFHWSEEGEVLAKNYWRLMRIPFRRSLQIRATQTVNYYLHPSVVASRILWKSRQNLGKPFRAEMLPRWHQPRVRGNFLFSCTDSRPSAPSWDRDCSPFCSDRWIIILSCSISIPWYDL